MDKQIELAKSWFELAKIFATIAGFLIVAFGIFWSFTASIIDTSIQAIGEMNWGSSYSVNVSGPACKLLEAVPHSIDLSTWLFGGALFFGFFSLVLWFIERHKLKKCS